MNFRRVTFICGRAGVCALGAVVAKNAGDERLLDSYLTQFKEVPTFRSCSLYSFGSYLLKSIHGFLVTLDRRSNFQVICHTSCCMGEQGSCGPVHFSINILVKKPYLLAAW